MCESIPDTAARGFDDVADDDNTNTYNVINNLNNASNSNTSTMMLIITLHIARLFSGSLETKLGGLFGRMA